MGFGLCSFCISCESPAAGCVAPPPFEQKGALSAQNTSSQAAAQESCWERPASPRERREPDFLTFRLLLINCYTERNSAPLLSLKTGPQFGLPLEGMFQDALPHRRLFLASTFPLVNAPVLSFKRRYAVKCFSLSQSVGVGDPCNWEVSPELNFSPIVTG